MMPSRVPQYLLLACLTLATCSKAPSLAPLTPDAVILAFGDSLTAGNGASPGESYPAQLSRLLGREVINAGVSGETSGEGMQRLNGLLDQHRPALLILCHGGNDLLQKLPDTALEANLLAMINMAADRQIPVVLLGVPRPGLFLSDAVVFANVAQASNVVFIDDLVADVLSRPAMKSDPVHPNQAGYAEMARVIHAMLRDSGAI